jgi:ornithine carbamoyltransferase
LRTRVSFQAAMAHLGGGSMFLGSDVGWGSRESVADFVRVLSQYVDAIVVRARRHQTALDMAQYADCPIINGLTDYAHPCQVLADLYTLKELIGSLKGHTLAYVGDGNNVARSLAMICGKLGMRFAIASPTGYELDADYRSLLKREVPNLQLLATQDPSEAVKQATAVYTDVWASMGQESERDARRECFSAYQVTPDLMSQAPKDAWFMHCLPAHRGEEVVDEVIDGPQSVVVQQAANRLHVQKGILAWLLASKG